MCGTDTSSFSTVQNGFTPLYVACQNGHNEVCTVLLAAKASVDAATQVSRSVMLRADIFFPVEWK